MRVIPGSHRDARFGLEAYAVEMTARTAAEAAGKPVAESARLAMAGTGHPLSNLPPYGVR